MLYYNMLYYTICSGRGGSPATLTSSEATCTAASVTWTSWWGGVRRLGAGLHYAMLCYAMLCYAILYVELLYYTPMPIQYTTLQYTTILYNTIHYNTTLHWTTVSRHECKGTSIAP